MIFWSTSLTGLIQWCRAFRHGLGAGLSLVRVFQIQAKKGPSSLRDLAGRIAERLEKGETLEDTLNLEGQHLPTLFRQLTVVGEKTGHLPEMFAELGEHFELQQRLGREFRAQITGPIIQFVMAVLVIALLIFVLGIINSGRGQAPIAPIGFGLTGASGAITFLIAVATFLGSLFGLYLFYTKGLQQRTAFEANLLRLPVVGPCAQSFALGRFCVALRMTLETGMDAAAALRQSLRATGNAAFIAAEDFVAARIKAGDEIHEALRQCSAFPEEFREILEVAEVSGQIPETMIRQAAHYREESARQLKVLAKVAGHGVWLFVAILMIWSIFKIANIYIGMLNQA